MSQLPTGTEHSVRSTFCTDCLSKLLALRHLNGRAIGWRKELLVDPLNDLTSEAHRIASQARRAFLEGHPVKASEFIEQLYLFLGDESVSKLYAKCESAESDPER